MRTWVLATALLVAAGQADAAIVFDQTGNFSFGGLSQDYEPVLDAFDLFLIDDFTLAATTRLTTAIAGGIGVSGLTNLAPVQSWQVAFFTSTAAAGLSETGDAGNAVIAATDALIGPGVPGYSPSWTITLPIDVTLGPGTYWMGVRPRLDALSHGEFAIGTIPGGNALQVNPRDGFGRGPVGGSTGNAAAYRLDGVVVTAAVPEPAGWAMLIAGFGLIGAAMRRRRAVPA